MNYVYKGKDNESVKLVIKAEHANYGDNASTGTALDVKLSAEKVENLKVKLNGDSSIETEVGKYVEKGIKSIMYGETDITTSSSVKIEYQIVNGTSTNEFDSISLLETEINKLSAGTYKVNYIITYNNKKFIINRNITLK